MSPAAFRVMYEYMEASEHSSRSAPLLRYCSDCKTMMLQAQVTPALSVAPELYQTAETLTHLGHHAAEQGPPHLLGPSHVFARMSRQSARPMSQRLCILVLEGFRCPRCRKVIIWEIDVGSVPH